jgi:hypothetical protein
MKLKEKKRRSVMKININNNNIINNNNNKQKETNINADINPAKILIVVSKRDTHPPFHQIVKWLNNKIYKINKNKKKKIK